MRVSESAGMRGTTWIVSCVFANVCNRSSTSFANVEFPTDPTVLRVEVKSMLLCNMLLAGSSALDVLQYAIPTLPDLFGDGQDATTYQDMWLCGTLLLWLGRAIEHLPGEVEFAHRVDGALRERRRRIGSGGACVRAIAGHDRRMQDCFYVVQDGIG